jgi:hypothetical protein
MNSKIDEELEKIALLWLNIPTLEEREAESYDLHACHVHNLKKALQEAYELGKENVRVTECKELVEAIRNFHKTKNRYDSQIACAKLFELAGLPNQYPSNYKKHENSKS